MSTEYNFRSAFVNGFHREDVIAYIEGLQKELLNANAGREKLQADYMTARKAAENYYANLNAALAHIKTLEAQIAQMNRDTASRIHETPAAVEPPAASPVHKDIDETVVIDENTLLLQNIEEKVEALLRDTGSQSQSAAQAAQQIAGGYAQQTQSLIGATTQSLTGLRAELEELSGKLNQKLNVLAEKIDTLSITVTARQEAASDDVDQPLNAEEPSGDGFVSSLENYTSSIPAGESSVNRDECVIEVETDAAVPDFIIYPVDTSNTITTRDTTDSAAQLQPMTAEPQRVLAPAEIPGQAVTQLAGIQAAQSEIPYEAIQTDQPPADQQPADATANDAPAAPLNQPVPLQQPASPRNVIGDVQLPQDALETQEDAFEFDASDSTASPSQPGNATRLSDLFTKPDETPSTAEGAEYSALLSENTLTAVSEENKQLTPEEIEKLMEMFPDDGETASD